MSENKPTPAAEVTPPKAETPKAETPPPPAVTRHQTVLDGRVVHYRAEAGLTGVSLGGSENKGLIFSVAYIAEPAESKGKGGEASAIAPHTRPVMFCFNGGPGSSSVWLQVGCLGPRRVDLPDGGSGPPPHRLVDNPEGLLDQTDLVFIDPVGTGFSRPTGAGTDADFHGIEGDIASVGEFIERWLNTHGRWDSPRFLCGESYGTTRSAGVAQWLGEHGITCNGLVLISLALDANTFLWNSGMETAFVLHLPSYAVAGWHHGKVQGESLEAVAEAARDFAKGPYLAALFAGNRIDAAQRAAVLSDLERHTGVPAALWDQHDLRMEQADFCRHLLAAEGKVVGRFDARYTAENAAPARSGECPDPSYDEVVGPFAAGQNTLLRRELGATDLPPYTLINIKANEGWVHDRKWWEGAFNLTDRLRTAMLAQPHLQVLVANGWYDLATPFFATEYTLDHLGRAPSLRARVQQAWYPSGHMMYLHPPSRRQIRTDLSAFIARSAPGSEPVGGGRKGDAPKGATHKSEAPKAARKAGK